MPNIDKGKKATCKLTWENIFPVKVFFSSSESKTLEKKKNSQHPSVNDPIQQLLVTNNNTKASESNWGVQMRNACDYKEVYPWTGESGAGIGKLLLDVLLQSGYHGAHANQNKKNAEPHYCGVPSVNSQFAKSAGKGGTINIIRKIVRTNTQPNKHAYHIDT